MRQPINRNLNCKNIFILQTHSPRIKCSFCTIHDSTFYSEFCLVTFLQLIFFFQKPTANMLKEIWLVISYLLFHHNVALIGITKDNGIKNSVTAQTTSLYIRLIPVCFCSNLFCTTPVCLCNQSKELLPRKPIKPRPLVWEKCRYLTSKIPCKITWNSKPGWTYPWYL